MNRIQNKDHRIGKYEIKKSSLYCFDDKIYVQNNGYDGLALGYYNYIIKKTVTLITIQKSFLVKHIVLISRTAFFLNLSKYFQTFSLRSKFEKHKALKKS